MSDVDLLISSLRRRVDELYDAQVRQRRMLDDVLYNLDEENMPAVKEIIERYRTESKEAVASLSIAADENGAAISALVQHQRESDVAIAAIEATADENGAAVKQLASLQTEQGESIAGIEAKVDERSAEILLAAERAEETASNAQSTANDAKENSSNGAYIIARINDDGSVVKIRADKLELSGYATFASLENEGETAINGANLKTGTVDAEVLKTGGRSQTGTALGNNLMFNAGAEKYYDAEARYLFFVDPALYNVFIGVEGGADAKILRIHAEGNGLFDSYGGERLYLGSIAPGNELVTRSEVEDMISAALEGGDVPVTIYAPKISPSSGDYAMPVTVEITNYNSTGEVYYTVSGAGSADGTYLYTGPFDIYDSVEDAVTVSAYCRTDNGDSEESSVTYYLSA